MIIGLAARCPLTFLMNQRLGMDEGGSEGFLRALLKDYMAHPRTMILSSHHMMKSRIF